MITPGACGAPYVGHGGWWEYPVLHKGRADLKIGPKPYPTPYYAFRVQISGTPGVSVTTTGNKAACAGTKPRIQRQVHTTTRLEKTQLVYSGLTEFIEDGNKGFLPYVSSETKGRARISAINKLRSSNLDLGQSIGEIPTTMRELYGLLLIIGKSLHAARRGKFSLAMHYLGISRADRKSFYLRSGSNYYLAYQFGLAPLINDAMNMVEGLKEADNKPLLLSVKGTATDRQKVGNSEWKSDNFLTEICEVGYIVKTKADFSNAFLGLLNPLYVAWALVPFSFLIDWFVSIGSALEGLGAGVGLDVVAGYETTVIKGRFTLKKDYGIKPFEYQVNTFAMERRVLSNIAIPGLYFKTQPWSYGKATTLTALILSFSLENRASRRRRRTPR
jgi:hypothetical protein